MIALNTVPEGIGYARPYTDAQRQQIIQWIRQRVPRLTTEGCPLCNNVAGLGVERLNIPDIDVPLLAVACRSGIVRVQTAVTRVQVRSYHKPNPE